MRLPPGGHEEVLKRLRQVRKSGYAIRVGGHPRNTSSIAVPVKNRGWSKAAIVVSFLTSAIDEGEARKLFVAQLQAAAAEIEHRFALEECKI
jgi:DNA-binding IclR family transcriptional regulator